MALRGEPQEEKMEERKARLLSASGKKRGFHSQVDPSMRFCLTISKFFSLESRSQLQTGKKLIFSLFLPIDPSSVRVFWATPAPGLSIRPLRNVTPWKWVEWNKFLCFIIIDNIFPTLRRSSAQPQQEYIFDWLKNTFITQQIVPNYHCLHIFNRMSQRNNLKWGLPRLYFEISINECITRTVHGWPNLQDYCAKQVLQHIS